MKNNKIAIIMGSQSDYPTMKNACDLCYEFDVSIEVHILSAHRTPDEMRDFAMSAKKNGIKVIIAGAGGAAHLPGMTASYTTLPVIGVPIQTNSLNGIDSLYSIVQMPKGIPVATVAIGNASNAALLAIQILALSDSLLSEKLEKYREKLKKDVELSRSSIPKI